MWGCVKRSHATEMHGPPDEPFLLPVPDDAAPDLAALWVDLGGGCLLYTSDAADEL